MRSENCPAAAPYSPHPFFFRRQEGLRPRPHESQSVLQRTEGAAIPGPHSEGNRTAHFINLTPLPLSTPAFFLQRLCTALKGEYGSNARSPACPSLCLQCHLAITNHSEPSSRHGQSITAKATAPQDPPAGKSFQFKAPCILPQAFS